MCFDYQLLNNRKIKEPLLSISTSMVHQFISYLSIGFDVSESCVCDY